MAIIGMAGRFPRARNVREFWRNISQGVECISRFAPHELEIPNATALANDPNYIRARGTIEDADRFDAAFFGILPRDAELIDPQHRVFLECCWEAFEDAGYDPQAYPGAVSVYAGCSANTYFLRNVCGDRGFVDDFTGAYPIGNYSALLGANHDFLATRVSYKLNLKGPSFTLQCGCSTSLVAVSQACQSLLGYQSDMALAGGVSITFPQERGYFYVEGGMGSRDGHCRSFDADAQGTVFGSGAGVVLLKRLEDALADGDHIYAVIKGFALNNDGAAKVGYTAPSVEGQAEVIAMAQAMAGFDAESIGYIEAHGTATPMGDPIEFAALTRAFRAGTRAEGFCALGTAKMNVGHLDIAAGVTGLINAVSALKHQQLPPSIHFNTPNPEIDLAGSPFYVNKDLTSWKRGTSPRRAGVSAFGVGGTNAHVVLEEAPPLLSVPGKSPAGAQLLILSARTAPALEQATDNLVAYLEENPEADLRSVAYTLQVGRRNFEHRRVVAVADRADAVRALSNRDPKRVTTRQHEGREPRVVFMFPGQGTQSLQMGAALYDTDREFAQDIDRGARILATHLGLDVRAAIYPGRFPAPSTFPDLADTQLAQPSLFLMEYAMAQLWMRRGVKPSAMIGHSVGELVAACLAGVFSFEDALAIIGERGRMMQGLARGGMLSVRLGEAEVAPLLNGSLSLAAANSPRHCVVSGPDPAIDLLHRKLEEYGVGARRLATSHAFHSATMDAIIGPFTDFLRQFQFHAPTIPYISSASGTWITPEEATDPAYWARQLREPVRFSRGVEEIETRPGSIYLEAGPGHTLCTLVRQHRSGGSAPLVIASLPDTSDSLSTLSAAGQLWLQGVALDWPQFHDGKPQRCSLPTYPFERERFWIDRRPMSASQDNHGSRQVDAPVASTPRGGESMPEEKPSLASVDRATRIQTALKEIFEDLSGSSLSGCDTATTFLEMGFDSLFLTQVTQAIQAKFGLKLTFRQLLDQESTLEALMTYVDARLPAEAMPSQATPTPTAGARVPANALPETASSSLPSVAGTIAMPAGASSMETLFREQIKAMSQLMARQLEILSGAGATPIPIATGSVPPSANVATPPATPREVAPLATETRSATAKEFKPFGPYKPVQKGPVGGLEERQARYLAALIGRYSARTIRSKEYAQTHRRVLADPRVAAGFRSQWKEMVYPIVTARSRGSRLWDLDGNEYIDILNGFGPIMLGHAPEFVTRAVRDQLDDGFEIGPQAPLAGKVAALVCELTGLERATFCNTGSEAVMAAMRVARTVTGRSRIVVFAGAYHGTFDEVLVRRMQRGGEPYSMPIAPGIPPENLAHVTVLDYGTSEALDYIRTHAQELAGVLVEPVQSRHPALQPVAFLRELRRITAESGAALIFDEVVTGFRVHPGGAQALFGIQADLATYGKVVGGGLPIGILAGRAAFMDALDGGMWQYGDESFPEKGVTFFAGTFVRHPLALAAVNAVLEHLKEQGPSLQEALNTKTARMVGAINADFETLGVPTRIEHFGSIFYFNLPPDQRLGSLLYYHLREKGIYIQEGFPCFLTTEHSEADIEKIIRGFRESIIEMQDGGALPASPRGDGSPTDRAACASELPTAIMPLEVPATESQMEILLSARVSDEASCAYNESFTLHLRGSLSVQTLRDAIGQLLERHDALRSTFDPRRGCIHVRDRIDLALPVVDLSALAGEANHRRLAEIIGDDAALPFDLIEGPLVRATLVRLEPEYHALVFTSHHLVCDGWSTNILLDELSQLYTAKSSGGISKLAAALPFSRHALTQAEWLQSPERKALGSWWTKRFAESVDPLELPADRPRPSVKSFAGGTARRRIDAEHAAKIRRFGAQSGCTMFATLLAAFKVLLHRLSNQADIVVGIPAAGQSLLDGETLVGHCVNFLPLRTSLDGNLTVKMLMDRVKGTLLDAYEHQNYTYGSLVQELALRRDPGRLPLVEVQFNLERVGSGLTFPGLEVEVEPNPKAFVNFDIFLNVVESDQGLSLIHICAWARA